MEDLNEISQIKYDKLIKFLNAILEEPILNTVIISLDELINCVKKDI